MGNSLVPQHGEKYVDFCARTNYHNLYPDKHKEIIAKFDKFSRHSGAVFCFNYNECNLKQCNFLKNPESELIAMKVRFSLTVMYLCYLDEEWEKEFNRMDIADRDALFEKINFKDICTRDGIRKTDWDAPGVNVFNDEKSNWYCCEKYLGLERSEFLRNLIKTGFAHNYEHSGIALFYCTPQQFEKFLCGKYSNLNQEQISKMMLANLKSTPT